jgi:hypothetical protein
VAIIRRNNCVYATLGTCYSVWMTVWYTGWNENGKISFIPPCIPDRHPHRITSTKCRTNTVVSPDDGHIVSRNMYRLINILRINILRINCAPSWLYLQDCTGMYGQQDIKFHFEKLVPNCPVMLRVVAQIGGLHLIRLFLTKVMVHQCGREVLPFIHLRIFYLSLLWLNNSKFLNLQGSVIGTNI